MQLKTSHTTKQGTPGASPGQSDPSTVILLDDHAWYRRVLAQELAQCCGAVVLQASNSLEVLTMLIERNDVVAVIADMRIEDEHGHMVGLQGDALLDVVHERFPRIRRALVTAYPTGATAIEGHLVLDKSWPMSVIVEKLCELVQ